MRKRKTPKRQILRTGILLNPIAIGATYAETVTMVERVLDRIATPQQKGLVMMQAQVDTGYVAIALRTRWRDRSIFFAQRMGGMGEMTLEDTVIICINESKVPFFGDGGDWDDIDWDDLREFSWGLFLKFIEDLLIEIQIHLSNYRAKSQDEKGFTDLQANMIFNLVFVGDTLWIPKQVTNSVLVGKTSEFYS